MVRRLVNTQNERARRAMGSERARDRNRASRKSTEKPLSSRADSSGAAIERKPILASSGSLRATESRLYVSLAQCPLARPRARCSEDRAEAAAPTVVQKSQRSSETYFIPRDDLLPGLFEHALPEDGGFQQLTSLRMLDLPVHLSDQAHVHGQDSQEELQVAG